MKQKRKLKNSYLPQIFLVIFYLNFCCCKSQSSDNTKKSESFNSETTIVNNSLKSSSNKKKQSSIEPDVICLHNHRDNIVGMDTTWTSQLDFNPNKNKVDTIWNVSIQEEYSSLQLDKILKIKEGRYIDYNYYGGECNYDIINKINTNTELAYTFILDNNDSGCKSILNILEYERPHFVSFAFEKPINEKHINYLAIGIYIKRDGSIYDNRNNSCVFEGETQPYRIEKVYGLTKNGELEYLKNKTGVAINPNQEEYYFSDTIVFNKPY